MLVPEPVDVIPPGFLVRVHVPEDGNPFTATLPVELSQSGCVILPIEGTEGVGG